MLAMFALPAAWRGEIMVSVCPMSRVGLLFGALLLSACAADPIDDPCVGPVLTFDFDDYLGTAETLPASLSVRGEDGDGLRVEDGYDPFTGVHDASATPVDPFEGFGAFTSDGGGYSFGIRERGEVDLRDARLLLRFENTTGEVVYGFDVS